MRAIHFSFRKSLPVLSLLDLPLEPALLKATENLGFNSATEVQSLAIPAILEGNDVMVSAPTGSGKTAAFLLPLLHRLMNIRSPYKVSRALILLPTRELALQTLDHLQKLAEFTEIKAALIIGGESFKKQLSTLGKNPEVLIATPGRLVEHIESESMDLGSIEFLLLDEADRMLQMGFAEDLKVISSQCRAKRQNLLFSATLDHESMSPIRAQFVDPVSIEVGSQKADHSHIVQQLVLSDDRKHKEALTFALIEEEQADKVFVFCSSRLQCEQLSSFLRYKKLKVSYIHGELNQSLRKKVMTEFRQQRIQVLVATDLAARGLDIEGVGLVINYSVARTGDDHAHRVGRTGRAGQEGKAVSLISDLEWNKMASIQRYLGITLRRRVVQGLKAQYTGPKKLKNSGKAAGTKKKKRKIKTGAVKKKAKKG
ncbi:MAG: DEAD/DEAH box helicase [Ketobacter sp.]|nr:MAG: DEAD/DEAH box helicase [Ketobacter sp.]